jgi:hypothetical protein
MTQHTETHHPAAADTSKFDWEQAAAYAELLTDVAAAAQTGGDPEALLADAAKRFGACPDETVDYLDMLEADSVLDDLRRAADGLDPQELADAPAGAEAVEMAVRFGFLNLNRSGRQVGADTVTADELVEAYHVIYDMKDAHLDDTAIRTAAYETLAHLATLIELTGGAAPRRFDSAGRQT